MKIAVISGYTPSLFNFRMDMMREFLRQGHEVVAMGPDAKESWAERFAQEGISYVQIQVSRNGLNPYNDWKTYRSIKNALKQERPDKIFVYLAKTVAYGSMAARSLGIKELYPMVSGLGSIIRGKGLKNSLVKMVMTRLYKIAFAGSRAVIFQNKDDSTELVCAGLLPEAKCQIVNGSGVNLEHFTPHPYPTQTSFLFIGRLIKDKGIMEFLNACRILKSQIPDARCLIVGSFDTNPTALSQADLDTYIQDQTVEYLGYQEDVRAFINECTCFVLPSYHEGTPRCVLEAMATGRAIITTDAPGCRETVEDGVNGFLVPVKDAQSLAEKMIYLAQNPKRSQEMAEASLKIAREKYDVKLVNASIMKIMNITP